MVLCTDTDTLLIFATQSLYIIFYISYVFLQWENLSQIRSNNLSISPSTSSFIIHHSSSFHHSPLRARFELECKEDRDRNNIKSCDDPCTTRCLFLVWFKITS